ncbi:hypothetical protein P3X46_004971 [Hevea brasiliensis]|uniref:DUF4283 domain-containing protein n=1 Tax=Hevea brasiliensis TaxID=3981 RepID=A0ABQ9N091_HEVBR|nr:hypothetical protein P3X46_004971 [Hevea brasiliensis]
MADVSSSLPPSSEEVDQLHWSSKKVKLRDGSGNGLGAVGKDTVDVEGVATDVKLKSSFHDAVQRSVFEDLEMANDGGHVVDISDYDSDGELDDDYDLKCSTIRASQMEKRLMSEPWRKTLIIKVLGRKIGFSYLQKRLKQLWALKSPIDMIDLVNGFFMVRFSNETEDDHVLFGGPWMFADHYLIVREWQANFDPEYAVIDKALYYSKIFLMRVASKIGRPIKVDETTLNASRGKFARICVEVDLSKPLLFQYEGIHLICFQCCCYGLRQDTCTKAFTDLDPDAVIGVEVHGARVKDIVPVTDIVDQVQNVVMEPPVVSPEVVDRFGPWMLAKRSGWKGAKLSGNSNFK